MGDDLEAVKVATVRRFRDIASRYQECQQRINDHQQQIALIAAEQQILQQQAQRCYATAELFGFDLVATSVTLSLQGGENAPPVAAAAPPPPPPPVIPAKTVKDHVVDIAQQAHPNAVRASAIRKQLEAIGIVVHEKTVGMTLYRLSREGVIRREGKADWYFVPEAQRHPAAAPGGEESPGHDPGLLLDTAR